MNKFILNSLFLIVSVAAVFGNNTQIIDEYYKQILKFKKESSKNKIQLIRNVKFNNQGQDSVLNDTSYFVLAENYNKYSSLDKEIIMDNFYFAEINKLDKKIIIKDMMKNQKFPVLYSIIDLNNLEYEGEDKSFLKYKKFISKSQTPLQQNYMLYYFDKSAKLLTKIEYYYFNYLNLISSELLINYSDENCTKETLNHYFFDKDNKLKNEFNSFRYIDQRKKIYE